MKPESKRSYSLCPDCDACPTVEMRDDGTVTIGEAPHVAILTAAQWNVLVKGVRQGALTEVA
jgi:hypothetical protein